MCRTFCVLRRIFQKNRENTYSLYSYLPFYNYTLSIWNRYRPSGALLFQQKVTIPHSKHYFPRSEIYHWSRWYQFFSQIFRFSICYKRFTSSQNTQKPWNTNLVKIHQNSKFLLYFRFKFSNSTEKIEKIKKIRRKLQKPTSQTFNFQPPSTTNLTHTHVYAHFNECAYPSNLKPVQQASMTPWIQWALVRIPYV